MPNRLLREGICTSDLINNLSAEEEVFFYRLLVICDDFGHADARPAILKANCFPLKDSATQQQIQKWIEGLVSKGMIRRYSAMSKQFLAIAKWEARVRTHPKFPLPDAEGSQWIDAEVQQFDRNLSADCGQMTADCGLGKGKGKGKGAGSQQSRELLSLPESWEPKVETVTALSRELGLVTQDVQKYVASFADYCRSSGKKYRDHDAAFRNCVRQDWPKFRAGKPAQRASGLETI